MIYHVLSKVFISVQVWIVFTHFIVSNGDQHYVNTEYEIAICLEMLLKNLMGGGNIRIIDSELKRKSFAQTNKDRNFSNHNFSKKSEMLDVFEIVNFGDFAIIEDYNTGETDWHVFTKCDDVRCSSVELSPQNRLLITSMPLIETPKIILLKYAGHFTVETILPDKMLYAIFCHKPIEISVQSACGSYTYLAVYVNKSSEIDLRLATKYIHLQFKVISDVSHVVTLTSSSASWNPYVLTYTRSNVEILAEVEVEPCNTTSDTIVRCWSHPVSRPVSWSPDCSRSTPVHLGVGSPLLIAVGSGVNRTLIINSENMCESTELTFILELVDLSFLENICWNLTQGCSPIFVQLGNASWGDVVVDGYNFSTGQVTDYSAQKIVICPEYQFAKVCSRTNTGVEPSYTLRYSPDSVPVELESGRVRNQLLLVPVVLLGASTCLVVLIVFSFKCLKSMRQAVPAVIYTLPYLQDSEDTECTTSTDLEIEYH